MAEEEETYDSAWLKRQFDAYPEAKQAALARHLGKNPAAVNRMLKPGKRGLRRILGTEVGKIQDFFAQFETPISGEVRRAPVSPPYSTLPNDVPVFGTAAGSFAGSFVIGEAIDHKPRPPGLLKARDIYAIYVVGSSMEPEHPPGELRFVNPHRPPRPGDSVIVQERRHGTAEVLAYIARFLRQTDKKLLVAKLNPEATVEFDRRFVIAVHKVMTTNELFGV